VIGAGSDRHQIVREPFNTVGAHRVRSNHHAQVVALEERIQVVGTEIDDVVLLLGVAHVVVLESVLFLRLMGVAPQQIQYFLVIL